MGSHGQDYYGEKIKYDAMWSGPLQVARTVTDGKGLIGLGIFGSLWIMLGIFAYRNGQIDKMKFTVKTPEMDEHKYKPLGWKQPVDADDYSSYVETLRLAKYIILGYISLSGVLTLFYIALLKRYTKFVAYLSILIILKIILIIIIDRFIKDGNSGRTFTKWTRAGIYLLVFLAVLAYLLAISERIPLASRVIKESIEATVYFPSIIILSMFQFIAYSVAVSYTLLIFITLGRSGLIINSEHWSITVICVILSLVFCLFNLFGFLWLCAFIHAFGRMILNGIFSSWFWTLNKEFVRADVVTQAAKVTIRYHLGTVALGSFITATCQVLYVILNCFKIYVGNNDDNPAQWCCCYWCHHLFIIVNELARIVSNNAYIVCASHGTNFVDSAKYAYNLLMRNIENVLIVDDVNRVIFYVGQFLAVGISVAVTYVTCIMDEKLEKMTYYVIAYVAMGSIILTLTLFEVVRAAADTLFLCALEDLERNDGSQSHPNFTSNKLKVLFIKSQSLSICEC